MSASNKRNSLLRERLLASAFVGVTALASTASFAFPSSRLLYSRGVGAERCPDEATMRKAVAQRLGYDPFFPTAEKTIVSRIVRDRDELRGTVELVDNHGMVRGLRDFKVGADDCAELVAAMSLAISIAIDPMQASLSSKPPIDHEPPTGDSGASEKREPPTQAAPPPEAAEAIASHGQPASPAHAGSLTIEPGLSVTTAIGNAPSPAIGLAASLGIRFVDVSLFLDGRHDWPASSDDVGGGRVRTSLWAVGLAPCLHRGVLFVCAVGSIGSLRGEGLALAQPRTESGLYAAAGGRVGFESRLLGSIYFRPQLDLLATLARVELQLDGTTRWTAPPFSALLQAGLVAHFP
jgi:hypothetical protein